jgi:hypothetical protein
VPDPARSAIVESTQPGPVRPSCGPIFAVGLALGTATLAAHVAGSVTRGVRSRLLAPSLPALARRGGARLLDAVIRAVVERINVGDLAGEVLDAIDLPELIRQSTGAMASDFVRHTRIRGAAADDAVGRVRNRLLRRQTRELA